MGPLALNPKPEPLIPNLSTLRPKYGSHGPKPKALNSLNLISKPWYGPLSPKRQTLIPNS